MKRKLYLTSAIILSSLVTASPAFATCAITDLSGNWNAFFTTYFGSSLPSVALCSLGMPSINTATGVATWSPPSEPPCFINSQVTMSLVNATGCAFSVNFTTQFGGPIPQTTVQNFLLIMNQNQNTLTGVGTDSQGYQYSTQWVMN